ncbi:hypothetical protein [Sinorhizobium medicae]
MHDILEVLARHNPGLSKTALKATGKVMAAISAATAQLTTEQQRKIVSHEDKLAEALGAVVADIASRDGPPLDRSEGRAAGGSQSGSRAQ